jgi:tetratricopeptide (TPR) repeat protein
MRLRSAATLALSVLLSLAFSASLSGEAHAKRPRISYQQRRDAKRLFGEGRAAYRRGDYELSIEKWQQSYQLSKEPLIFESIAAAYERLGKLGDALLHLEKWSDKAPRREQKAVGARIQSLRRRIEKIERQDREKREAEARRKSHAKAERDKKQRDKERQEREAAIAPYRLIGYGAVGLGGAAVIAGVVMDGVAAGSRPVESEACTRAQNDTLLCRASFADGINRSNTLAIAGDASWIAGAVLVTAGSALLLTKGGLFADDKESDSKSDTIGQLALGFRPGFIGVRWRRRF